MSTACVRLLSTVQFEELKLVQKNIAVFLENHLKKNSKAQLLRYVEGRAGTGKTVLLRYLHDIIVKYFGSNKACLLTGTTGASAENIGGVTLHSAVLLSINEEDSFGIMDQETLEHLHEKLKGVRFLFIDEISMLSSRGLSETNSILQRVLQCPLPFGGLSVFLFGDLLQLEPVNGDPVFEDLHMRFLPARNVRSIDASRDNKKENLFDSFGVFRLNEMVRVESEEDDAILQKIRIGDVTPEVVRKIKLKCGMTGHTNKDIFDELVKLESMHPGKEFVVLAVENKEVEQLNNYKIDLMDSPTNIKVQFSDSAPKNVSMIKKIEGKFAPSMKVAVGCKMMLNVNLDQRRGLVNGAIGRLLEIHEDYLMIGFKGVSTRIGKIGFQKGKKYWTTFPVTPAEACTVHKVQGLTFDGVIIKPGTRDLMPGLMYTALSRAKSLDLCRIVTIDPKKWKMSTKAKHRISQKRINK